MKKILLIAVLGTFFAAGSAFAHCGACGAGEEAHADKADVKKECCSTGESCCADKKAKCEKKCSKPCCAKEKAEEAAADETAAAKPSACCPAKKTGKPA